MAGGEQMNKQKLSPQKSAEMSNHFFCKLLPSPSGKDYKGLVKRQIEINPIWRSYNKDIDELENRIVVCQVFEIIHKSHIEKVTMEDISIWNTSNITKTHVEIYIRPCEINFLKNKPKKCLMTNPIIANGMNSHCQVDLIDYQSQLSDPNEKYKCLQNYQDHLPKFCLLWPLKQMK